MATGWLAQLVLDKQIVATGNSATLDSMRPLCDPIEDNFGSAPISHEWVGTSVKLQYSDLTWGPLVDLIGPIGLTGDQGIQGEKPAHNWVNDTLEFENPDGTPGGYTKLGVTASFNGTTLEITSPDLTVASADLIGPQGIQGEIGPQGIQGGAYINQEYPIDSIVSYAGRFWIATQTVPISNTPSDFSIYWEAVTPPSSYYISLSPTSVDIDITPLLPSVPNDGDILNIANLGSTFFNIINCPNGIILSKQQNILYVYDETTSTWNSRNCLKLASNASIEWNSTTNTIDFVIN